MFLFGGAWAAPLFPDVPDNHWAKDAVAALAAKGLVEGYPDGTFKGDRAASRYEVAMIVARLLAKMEQAHASFATKAELQELRKLADAYKEELEAFGVRVTNLEEQTNRLDLRVSELERIRF
ncbi:MAG: S-layer homology domain-containing protein, partial [Candidatus Eremiobacteraeota bacterium]|nr:S-layer homology domain-containing protein [Candidatus Eremiobacteraeota bacterium]